MVTYWIFAVVFVPMSTLIGIASATIGFTAWTIVVPLLFVGFGFNIFESLFVSILVDCCDGLVLTLIYATQGRVDWTIGLILGGLSALCAYGSLFSAKIVLDESVWLLKRGMGYGIVLIGLAFIARWYMIRRKMKKNAKQQKGDDESSHLINGEASLVEEDVQRNLPYHDDDDVDGVMEETPHTQTGGRSMEYFYKIENDKIPKWWMIPLAQCIIVFLLSVGSGVLSGLLGFGSGLNFVLITYLLLRFDLLDATATGCFIMFIIMMVMSVGYAIQIVPVDLGFMWPYALLAVGSSATGCCIGSILALRISPLHLRLLVGIVLVFVGALAVVQPFVLKHHHL